MDFKDYAKKDAPAEYKPKEKVSEIKCTCNQCGKVWHYLGQEKKGLEAEAKQTACVSCLSFGCIPVQAYFVSKSSDKCREAQRFDRCPNCNSSDIKKETVEFQR